MKINACYLAPPVRIGRFCLRKVLLSTWPCWWQLSYLNSGKDTRHLLNGVTYTISVPLCDRQLLPNKAYINSTHLPLKRTAPKMLSKCLYYILFSVFQSLFTVLKLRNTLVICHRRSDLMWWGWGWENVNTHGNGDGWRWVQGSTGTVGDGS